MAGPRLALEFVADAFDAHRSGEAARVNLFHGGSKNVFHAELLQRGAVRLEAPRIFFEILSRAELRWIDKDGDGDGRTLLPCRAHKREMSLMQSAHRGDEADDSAGGLCGARGLLHPVDAANDFHVKRGGRLSRRIQLCAAAARSR